MSSDETLTQNIRRSSPPPPSADDEDYSQEMMSDDVDFEQQLQEIEPQDSPQNNGNAQMNIVSSLNALDGAS